jgi:hypothetical protein
MYRGQIAEISNAADWVAPFFVQLVDDTDGSIINILNPDIGFDCVVSIGCGPRGACDDYEFENCNWTPIISASIAAGTVIVESGDTGPGFQWSFTRDQLACLCSGTYKFGIKTTTNDEVNDIVIGSIVVVGGN